MWWLNGVVALLGVALGAWLGSRREAQAWLRDRRMEAYVDFMSAARNLLYRGAEVRGSSDEREVARDKVRDVMQQLRDRATPIALIAPEEVREAAERVKSYFGDDLYDYFMSTHEASESEEVRQAQDLAKAFEDAARQSLSRLRRTG